jgi:glycine oxidase
MADAVDIVIAGAGPWGLATAWRCARAGATVAVLDDARPPAAHVAAGMLGARSEAREDEPRLFEILRASEAAWDGFAAELETAAGRDTGHRRTGALAVAARPEHLGQLRARQALLADWGCPAEWLTGSELRRRQPGLGPAASGGLDIGDEHQVETRRLLGALAAAARGVGVEIRRAAAAEVVGDGAGRPSGLRDTMGRDHPAGRVVIAAGHGSGPLASGVPVRPVKGQILRLCAPEGAEVPIARTVRTPSVYLVPRDGELVVGATVEERTDLRTTAGAVHELLDEAVRLVPEIAELDLVEVAAGLRPATVDGLPVIGEDADGVIWVTGGYRNGILLTPTASRAAAALAEGSADPWAAGLSPRRFEDAGS